MATMLKHVILAATLVTAPAQAPTTPARATYSAYAHGLNVMRLTTMLDMEPRNYRVEVAFQLTGLVGFLVHGDSKTVVDGVFQGDQAQPRELFSAGHLRGGTRVTQIDWQNGNPVVMQLVPPVEQERDPVPASEQAHTIDTLSAMVVLLHEVAERGQCDGARQTFDGRRLSEISAHTVGPEVLPPTSRSSFQGVALRCDFDGRQLAGFLRDADQADLRRPQHGSAWFARVTPGGPPIPVRIVFQTRQFGATTMYLTGTS
ncbi:MAG: DUF3108 domain-containing protein [Acetobacteraceae bacterium]